MRIWFDPAKLQGYKLSAEDVTAAIRSQNAQVASGAIGDLPNITGQKIAATVTVMGQRSEEHTSELQSPCNLVCRLLLEKKKKIYRLLCETRDICSYRL